MTRLFMRELQTEAWHVLGGGRLCFQCWVWCGPGPDLAECQFSELPKLGVCTVVFLQLSIHPCEARQLVAMPPLVANLNPDNTAYRIQTWTELMAVHFVHREVFELCSGAIENVTQL